LGSLKVYKYGLWNFKQSREARNRVGVGLLYQPARLHSLAELSSLEPILGLLKSLKIRALLPNENRGNTNMSSLLFKLQGMTS